MKLINYGITFYFKQYYLPTKRHKKEEERELVTCRDVKVRELTEDEFPVALKVTDYGILPDKEGEYKVGTIDLRWDGEHLYKEYRDRYGAKVLKLIPVDKMRDILQPSRDTIHSNPDKPFVEGTSVIISDSMQSKIDSMEEKASRYVIFDDKLWVKCSQPFYNVMTFGCSGDGTGFFIEWADSPSIDRDYYLATQRDLAIRDYHATAFHHGDKKEENEMPERNIEILIPEAYTLKRDLESTEFPGYMWNDERRCYVKEYGSKPAHAETFHIRFRHDWGDKYMAIVYAQTEKAFTNIASVWYAAGQVLEDCRKISFDDISEIYSVGDNMDLLKWMEEHKEATV